MNLIAFDLVYVYPMSSMSGYVNYLVYTTGSKKGEFKTKTDLNSPFALGAVDENYTSSKVVEPVTAGEAFAPAWTPMVKGSLKFFVDGVWTAVADDTAEVPDKATKVAYEYDNVRIPQNDLPILNVEMRSVDLHAKARRIAIYYSQIAAFLAKQDYGFDMGDELAAKAVGQLSYEIDTEICNGLITAAPSDSDLVWSKTLPIGVSKQEHYAGFVEVLEIAAQKIFDRTKRLINL